MPPLVMADTVMAYVAAAYTFMAVVVTAYIVMAMCAGLPFGFSAQPEGNAGSARPIGAHWHILSPT